MPDTISVRDLRKSYGSLAAVDGVTLRGRGRGSSSASSAPTAPARPPPWRSSRAAQARRRHRSRCSASRRGRATPRCCPGSASSSRPRSFFERLTAREQIRTFASLYGVGAGRADEMLGVVGLTEQADIRAEKLSGGQTQRLSIACALVHDPELVFLDEPTGGAGPAGPAQPVGPAARDQRRRPDGGADHPLHGRGRDALRPGGHHGPRPDPGGRAAGDAGARPGQRRPGSASSPDEPVRRRSAQAAAGSRAADVTDDGVSLTIATREPGAGAGRAGRPQRAGGPAGAAAPRWKTCSST